MKQKRETKNTGRTRKVCGCFVIVAVVITFVVIAVGTHAVGRCQRGNPNKFARQNRSLNKAITSHRTKQISFSFTDQSNLQKICPISIAFWQLQQIFQIAMLRLITLIRNTPSRRTCKQTVALLQCFFSFFSATISLFLLSLIYLFI